LFRRWRGKQILRQNFPPLDRWRRNDVRLRDPFYLHLDRRVGRRGEIIGAVISREKNSDQHHMEEAGEAEGQAVSPR
jgi:hypothetical protein